MGHVAFTHHSCHCEIYLNIGMLCPSTELMWSTDLVPYYVVLLLVQCLFQPPRHCQRRVPAVNHLAFASSDFPELQQSVWLSSHATYCMVHWCNRKCKSTKFLVAKQSNTKKKNTNRNNSAKFILEQWKQRFLVNDSFVVECTSYSDYLHCSASFQFDCMTVYKMKAFIT